MNPMGIGNFLPMYNQAPLNKNTGGVSSLPQEFLTEGEYMFYDVLDEENSQKGDGTDQSGEQFLSRGELIKKDLEHLPFLTHETEHFIFKYISGSDSATDIESIADKREKAWDFICDFFYINPPDKHTFYIFSNDIQAYCPSWGKTFASRALPEEHMAGILYLKEADSYENVNYGHELTHLLEFYLLPNITRFPPYFREGMADLLSMSNVNQHIRYINFIKSGLSENPFIFTDEKLNKPEYMESASFLQYLIEISDRSVMLDLYKKLGNTEKSEKMSCERFDRALQSCFCLNLKELAANYYNYICSLWNCASPQLTQEDREAIKKLIKKSDYVSGKEDQKGINELYSNDFYYNTPATERDRFIFHMMPLENMESVNFEFTDLGTWLYGKTAAVTVGFKNKATLNFQRRVFAVEKLRGTWRLSPKYPGGKELQ